MILSENSTICQKGIVYSCNMIYNYSDGNF